MREAQLARIDDVQLQREIDEFRRATWQPGSLRRHLKKHRPDFVSLYSQMPSAGFVRSLSVEIATEPDRVFTAIEDGGYLAYYFLRTHGADDAMILVSRGGELRTLFRAQPLSRWLHRSQAIEVTARAR